jgi:hypothetical protein
MKNDDALSTNTIFTVGPFADSAERLAGFGSSVWFACLLDDSIRKHEKIQKEYEVALLNNDDELASHYLAELDLMEGVYRASITIFEVEDALS